MQNIKISLNQTSKLQNITLTGALSPDRLASSVDVIAVMLYCLVMDNSSDAIDVGDVREEFPLGPLSPWWLKGCPRLGLIPALCLCSVLNSKS